MCSVCFVYYSSFNWNHGWGSIIIKFLIPLTYLCKHSCGNRRQWRRWHFFSKRFLLILSIRSVTQMRYMPTCSLGREKPRSWFRPGIWPRVSNPTGAEAGFLQLPLPLSRGLVVVPGRSTPSWRLPSLRQDHREELCGFPQEDSVELDKPGAIAVCGRNLPGA